MPALARGADRPPAVAGLFYPDDPDVLRAEVRALLDGAAPPAPPLPSEPRAVLVPHAGYVYSGPVAAVAFRAVAARPRRVVLVGPAHRVAFRGVSAGDFARYVVPTGALPVDREAIAALERAGLVTVVLAAHAQEHCLEVMVPFLLERFGEVPILPLLAGDTDPAAVEAVLEAALAPGDLLLVSSDLSHYQPYAAARARDLATLDEVVHGRWRALGPYDACGFLGLAGALRVGLARGWRPVLLDYRNSGDTAGDRRRVVGYSAAAFVEAAA